MRFGSKRTWKYLLYSWPAAIILMVIVVLLGMSAWERYQTAAIMKQRRIDSEEETQKLQARKEELSEKVEYMEGERGIEEELRRNFDVAKPGEQVIILTGETKDVSGETNEPAKTTPWWQFWR